METKICPNCNTEKSVKSFGFTILKNGNIYTTKNCNTCRCKLTKLKKFGKYDLTPPSPYLFCEETMRQIKICSRCQKALPFDKFGKLYNGITSECLECRKEKRRIKYNSTTLEQRKAIYVKRKPVSPEVRKKYEQTRKEKYNTDETYRKNRLARARKQSAENRKKYKINAKISRQNRLVGMTETEREVYLERERKGRRMRRQLRQARERGGKFFVGFTKEEIIKRDGLNCYLCGKILKVSEVTLDHVLPLSRGGQHKPENIKIACRPCNLSKSTKTFTEFKKYKGQYLRFSTL